MTSKTQCASFTAATAQRLKLQPFEKQPCDLGGIKAQRLYLKVSYACMALSPWTDFQPLEANWGERDKCKMSMSRKGEFVSDGRKAAVLTSLKSDAEGTVGGGIDRMKFSEQRHLEYFCLCCCTEVCVTDSGQLCAFIVLRFSSEHMLVNTYPMTQGQSVCCLHTIWHWTQRLLKPGH